MIFPLRLQTTGCLVKARLAARRSKGERCLLPSLCFLFPDWLEKDNRRHFTASLCNFKNQLVSLQRNSPCKELFPAMMPNWKRCCMGSISEVQVSGSSGLWQFILRKTNKEIINLINAAASPIKLPKCFWK